MGGREIMDQSRPLLYLTKGTFFLAIQLALANGAETTDALVMTGRSQSEEADGFHTDRTHAFLLRRFFLFLGVGGFCHGGGGCFFFRGFS